MTEPQYIWIDDWDRFQHYKDRNPPWIKNYTELLGHDHYLDLSTHRRGVLHGIWLAYATGRRRLHADTRSLSARLNAKVTTRDLDALTHAGFIEVIASSVLAERLQTASNPASGLLASRASAPSREAETEAESPVGNLSADVSDHVESADNGLTPAADSSRQRSKSNGTGPPAIVRARLRIRAIGHELPANELDVELRDFLRDRYTDLTPDNLLELAALHQALLDPEPTP